MRPILLKAHTRSITFVKYNREGDLLFSAAKDHSPSVFYAHNGERIGTYEGHSGAVWSLDVNYDSTMLLTGSADNTARLWDVKTGRQLYTWQHRNPVRSVGFAHGDRMILTCNDAVLREAPTVYLYDLVPMSNDQNPEPVQALTGHKEKVNCAVWAPLNRTIITCSDDCTVRSWDPETGKEVASASDHTKAVRRISMSKDGSCFITASQDHSAKLYDTRTLQLLKTFQTERPVNASAISPLFNHIILGGGEDAQTVTQTSAKVGKFEVRFFHKIFQDELGSVKGHFGPINALDFSPDGRSFTSGAEDGFLRVHFLDDDYFEQGADDLSIYESQMAKSKSRIAGEPDRVDE